MKQIGPDMVAKAFFNPDKDAKLLKDEVLEHLVTFAWKELKQEAKLRHRYVMIGRIDCAPSLIEVAKLVQRARRDLPEAIGCSADDWAWTCRLGEVHRLRTIWLFAKEESPDGGLYDAKRLAEKVVLGEIQLWEFAPGEEIAALEVCFRGYQKQLRGRIDACRRGEVHQAKRLVQEVEFLRISWEQLGLSHAEVEEWIRQDAAAKARLIFHPIQNDGYQMVFDGNLLKVLRLLVNHDMSPEEAGIPRVQLMAAKEIALRWIQQAHQQPQDNNLSWETLIDFEVALRSLCNQLPAS
ncbi:MAG TPA: hypothetical protein VD907_01095 [Verrucomicrobiae bacterium]|nr:hypothetical protein [Verrucomicrobiae bacterium]